MGHAVITGAAGGIGGACVSALLGSGWSVTGLDVVAGAIEGADWLEVDVRDRAALGEIASQAGKVDLLVNAAGNAIPAPAAEMSPEDWKRVLDVCLTGTFFVSQAFYPNLKEDGATIVNIASVAARRATPMHANYCVAKAGVETLTEVLAAEWAPEIRVIGISPGAVSTPLLRRGTPEGSDRERMLLDMTPLGRVARPEEMARAIVALASDDFAFVTGATLAVDGGFLTGGWIPR